MVHNLIQDVYPHPEKFWITLDTQYKLGGVDFTSEKGSKNSFVKIDFVDIDRNPYDYEDPKEVFEVKTIRHVIDSKIKNYISLDAIESLILCKVYDVDSFVFPHTWEQEHALYFPSVNTLAIGSNLHLMDKKTFENNPIFLAIMIR